MMLSRVLVRFQYGLFFLMSFLCLYATSVSLTTKNT